jgi:hypothetical protein
MTNSLKNLPAAACGLCGGWTCFGGMSQHAKSDVPVDGRTGCVCGRRAKLPTPAESLACPEGLTSAGKRAHKEVTKFLNRFTCNGEFPLNPGGCQTFYSPAAWSKREGKLLKGAVLVIVFDGGDVSEHLSYNGDYNSADQFSAHMEAAGFRYEAENCWSGVVWAD